MILALEKLAPYGFNKSFLSEEDLLKICDIEQITVKFLDVGTSFYFCAESKCFIVIKKSLRGLRRTFALAHELAHHFLHGGRDASTAFFSGLLDSKEEFEADCLALVALIPLSALQNYEFLERYPSSYARKLFRDRKRLYFLYGI